MNAPRTAIIELREMSERFVDAAAERGDAWEEPGTIENLMVEAVVLMQSLADAMERTKTDFVVIERKRS